jgi:hypothetical protein
MNDVNYFKTGRRDLLDALKLKIGGVLVPVHSESVGSFRVLKDAIAPTLSNIERLAISRVDQPVHILFELSCDFRRKTVALHLSPPAVLPFFGEYASGRTTTSNPLRHLTLF